MRSLTTVLLLLSITSLLSCASERPDCAHGLCGDDPVIADELFDQVEIDADELDTVELPSQDERLVFASETTPAELRFFASAGQWIEVGVYSRGLHRVGVSLQGPHGLERHGAKHYTGSSIRPFFIHADGEYTLTIYSQSEPSLIRFDSGYVAYLETIAAPAPTPVSLTDEVYLIETDLFASSTPPIYTINSDADSAPLNAHLESLQRDQRLLLFYLDGDQWRFTYPPVSSTRSFEIPASTTILFDYESAWIDLGKSALTLSSSPSLASGNSREFTRTISDPHRVLDLQIHSSDLSSLELEVFHDDQLLQSDDNLTGFGNSITRTLYLPSPGTYTARITNTSSQPLTDTTITADLITPDDLGALQLGDTLSTELTAPFRDAERVRYFTFHTVDAGAFQARAHSPIAPGIRVRPGSDPDQVLADASNDAVDPGPLTQTDIAAAEPGSYLLQLREDWTADDGADIHLELQLDSPAEPFFAQESLDLTAGQTTLIEVDHARELSLELLVFHDGDPLVGPIELSSSVDPARQIPFLFHAPQDGAYEFHWQGPQTLKPIYPTLVYRDLDAIQSDDLDAFAVADCPRATDIALIAQTDANSLELIDPAGTTLTLYRADHPTGTGHNAYLPLYRLPIENPEGIWTLDAADVPTAELLLDCAIETNR